MADKVTVQVMGGVSKTLNGVSTIAQLKSELNLPKHVATLKGESADDNTKLSDYSFVTLAPAVKGGI